MRAKYYHIYSDGKTIKEITWDEWREIINQDSKRTANFRLIARVSDSELYLRKGLRYTWIQRSQLDQILEA